MKDLIFRLGIQTKGRLRSLMQKGFTFFLSFELEFEIYLLNVKCRWETVFIKNKQPVHLIWSFRLDRKVSVIKKYQ